MAINQSFNKPTALEFIQNIKPKEKQEVKENLFDFSNIQPTPAVAQPIQQPTQPTTQTPAFINELEYDIKKGATINEISTAYPELKGNTKLINELHFDITNGATLEQIQQAYPELGEQDINQLGLGAEAVQRTKDLGTQLSKRGSDIAEQFNRPATNALQPLGSAIGIAGDIIGAGADIISEGIAYATPDIIKEGLVGGAKGLWNMLSDNAKEVTVNAIKEGGEVYQSFKKENPHLADAIEGGLNIASIAPIGGGAKIASKGGKEVLEQTIKQTGKVTKGTEKLIKKVPSPEIKTTITRDIPESVVRKDLGFTPTERAKIEKIVGKTEGQYILEKGLAGKGKEELAATFAKQANDNFKGITNKLKNIKDTPKQSKVTTEALQDVLDQLTSSPKLKRAYAKDIIAVEKMLQKGKYTLAEKNAIRRAFDKVNTGMYTAQGKARSGIETAVDIDIRNNLSKELQNEAKKFGIDIAEMNKELRVGIELKDALLRRLSQEEKNNFVGLQDLGVSAILSGGEPITAIALIGAKKYGESLAPRLAQKVYNINKTKNVSSRMTRGNPITTSAKSSKLGLASDSVNNLVKPSKKTSGQKPKVIKKPVKEVKPKTTPIKKQIISKKAKDLLEKTINSYNKKPEKSKAIYYKFIEDLNPKNDAEKFAKKEFLRKIKKPKTQIKKINKKEITIDELDF